MNCHFSSSRRLSFFPLTTLQKSRFFCRYIPAVMIYLVFIFPSWLFAKWLSDTNKLFFHLQKELDEIWRKWNASTVDLLITHVNACVPIINVVQLATPSMNHILLLKRRRQLQQWKVKSMLAFIGFELQCITVMCAYGFTVTKYKELCPPID